MTHHPGHKHGTGHLNQHMANPVSSESGMKDPVCGMAVTKDSPHKHDYQDKSYYFCSRGCQEKFRANPEAFLKPVAVPVDMPADKNTAMPTGEFTCPMHPEIRQNRPGICPKCGMALEPVMPTATIEANPELDDFRKRFWWTLPLTILLVIIAMSGSAVDGLLGERRAYIELLIATPVVLWSGWPFFVRWARSILTLQPNMWTLIGTGTAAAYLYSLAATLVPDIFPDSFRMG